MSPIRAAAAVEQISVGDYTKLVNRRGTSSGWRGERGTVAETSTPQFAGVTPPGGELYAQPIISQWLLQDSKFDMGDFLVRNVADEFAFQEGAAFIAGDGIEKPRGFLTCDKVTTGDATRDFGKLQYIPSGVAAVRAIVPMAVLQFEDRRLLQPLDELRLALELEPLVSQALQHFPAHRLGQIGDRLLGSDQATGVPLQVSLEARQHAHQQRRHGPSVSLARAVHLTS